jgi:hypothetical protein
MMLHWMLRMIVELDRPEEKLANGSLGEIQF